MLYLCSSGPAFRLSQRQPTWSCPQPCPHILLRTGGLFETTMPVSAWPEFAALPLHLGLLHQCTHFPSQIPLLMPPGHGAFPEQGSALWQVAFPTDCVLLHQTGVGENHSRPVLGQLLVGSHTRCLAPLVPLGLLSDKGQDLAPLVRTVSPSWFLVSAILGKLWYKPSYLFSFLSLQIKVLQISLFLSR